MPHSTTFLLPTTLDTSAAVSLRQTLLDRIDRAVPVHLDGSEVARAGLACLQVLASGRMTAEAGGGDFRLVHCSNALGRMIALARLDDALGLDA